MLAEIQHRHEGDPFAEVQLTGVTYNGIEACLVGAIHLGRTEVDPNATLHAEARHAVAD